MPKTVNSQGDSPAAGDGKAHLQLSAMIDAGREFSGHERNCCFLNTRDGRFADLSAGSGIDFPDDGRALVSTDWDQDGDLDLWISNRNAPRLRLLRNDSASGNHYLALKLVGNGETSNRDAIGARVEIRRQAGDKPPLIHSVRAGEGFLSQSSKWLHVGLGPDSTSGEVTVRWPDRSRETFPDLAVDRRYRLVQGSGKGEALPVRAGVTGLSPSIPAVAASGGTARIPAITLLRAPKLNIRRPDGSPGNLGEGKPLLINLWATWCAPCLRELGEFRDRADALRAAGVDVLALNVDDIGSVSGIRDPEKVLADLKFPFPSTNATPPLVAALQEFHDNLVGLHSPLPVPASFLIDAQGRLSVLYKGPVSVDRLLADLKHSGGSLDERLLASAQVEGSLIDHPVARQARSVHEGSLNYRYGLARLADNNDLDGASYHFLAALEADPRSGAAARQLGYTSLEKRDWDNAKNAFERVLGLQPDDPDAHLALAQLEARSGPSDEARSHFEETLRLRPDQPLAHFGLAALQAARNEAAPAVAHYRAGLKLQPSNHFAANNLAWLLATHADDTVREPAEALRLAAGINTATGDKDPNILDTLGVAQAATGDFKAAAHTAQRALTLAGDGGDEALAKQLADRLALYQAGQPYREPSTAAIAPE